MWVALTYHFCYKELVLHYIRRLQDGEETKHWVFIFWGTGLLVLCNLIETLNYLIVVPHIVNEPTWSDNILAKCPGVDISEAFQNKSEI